MSSCLLHVSARPGTVAGSWRWVFLPITILVFALPELIPLVHRGEKNVEVGVGVGVARSLSATTPLAATLALCIGDVRIQPPFWWRTLSSAIQLAVTHLVFPATTLDKPLSMFSFVIGGALLLLGVRKFFDDMSHGVHYFFESWIVLVLLVTCFSLVVYIIALKTKANLADVVAQLVGFFGPPAGNCCEILCWAIRMPFVCLGIVLATSFIAGFIFYLFGALFPPMRSTYVNYNCESLQWMSTAQLPSIAQALFLILSAKEAYKEAVAWMRAQGVLKVRFKKAYNLCTSGSSVLALLNSWQNVSPSSPQLSLSVDSTRFTVEQGANAPECSSGMVLWVDPETFTFPVHKKDPTKRILKGSLALQHQKSSSITETAVFNFDCSIHNMEENEWVTRRLRQNGWTRKGNFELEMRFECDVQPEEFAKRFDQKRLFILVPWMVINVIYAAPLGLAMMTHILPGLIVYCPLTVLVIIFLMFVMMPMASKLEEQAGQYRLANDEEVGERRKKEEFLHTDYWFKVIALPAIILVPFYGEAMVRFYARQSWWQSLYDTWAERTIQTYFLHLRDEADPVITVLERFM